MSIIPLCVPFKEKEIVKSAGAKWDKINKMWYCYENALKTAQYIKLKPYVPRRYQPDLSGPIIRPFMVPQPLWGYNLRAVLEKSDWDTIRKSTYQKYGNRCFVCGQQGDKWPVEADEAWKYNDSESISTLMGVVALCPKCHSVRHLGHSLKTGQGEIAITWMKTLNGWNQDKVNDIVGSAFSEWNERSNKSWNIDYSWAERVYGVEIVSNASQRAQDINKSILKEAERVDADNNALKISTFHVETVFDPLENEVCPKVGDGMIRRHL